MSILDLRPQSSFTYSTNCFYRDHQKPSMPLGHGKAIYLFFNLPLWVCNYAIVNARLILFKFPYDICSITDAASKENITECYALYPLLEVFNVYGCPYSPPTVDFSRGVPFQNSYRCSHTQINVTKIVQDWSNDTLENNGFLLMGENNSSYILYASGQHSVCEMRPMLRLTCKNADECRKLTSVTCDVEVSKPPLA